MKPDKPTQDGNQGEGDRESDRRYTRNVQEFVASGRVDPAAHGAEDYVEAMPDDAARAERKARRGPHPTKVTIEELVAKGRTVLDRVENLVRRVIHHKK